MKFVKLIKHKLSGYEVIADNDDLLCSLIDFLECELFHIMAYEYFADWLLGKFKQDSAYGNVKGLIEKDNRIYVFSLFAEEDDERFKYFNATKQEMYNIITHWVMLFTEHKKYPTEILITQDENEKVEIKGTYPNERQNKKQKIKFVKLIKCKTKQYEIIEKNDIKLHSLIYFLQCELLNVTTYEYFVDWLLGKFEQDRANGNVKGLIKKNNRIYVFSIFEENEKEWFKYFHATKQKMHAIITHWVMLFTEHKEYPTEILITQKENGKVEFKGTYPNEKQTLKNKL